MAIKIWKINVKQTHIDKGEPKNPKSCPVSLALMDMGFKDICVAQVVATFETSRATTGVILPPSAIEFIRDFDNGEDVAPFTFEIRD